MGFWFMLMGLKGDPEDFSWSITGDGQVSHE